jgi:hypothetical protein
MIEGINPYTISCIRMSKFSRWGRHPAWLKVMKKRHPIKAFFGLYEPDLFDGLYRPYVKIYGSNGNLLRSISCRSNDHARQLCSELNVQLDEFIQATKVVDK